MSFPKPPETPPAPLPAPQPVEAPAPPPQALTPVHPSTNLPGNTSGLEGFAPPPYTGAHLDAPISPAPEATPPEQPEPQPTNPSTARVTPAVGQVAAQAAAAAPKPPEASNIPATPSQPPQGPTQPEPPVQAEVPQPATANPEGSRTNDVRATAWESSSRLIEGFTAAETELAQEGKTGPWHVFDSGLEKGEEPIAWSFAEVTPEGKTMKQDVMDCVSSVAEPQKIGLELGGTGSRLFGEFPEGTFDKTVSVNLTDYRHTLPDGEAIIERDAQRNHTVVAGDVLAPATQDAVDNTRGDTKFAAIIERMAGAIKILPKDAIGMAEQANTWYERLAEGGVMYMGVPAALEEHLEQWRQHIAEHAPELEVSIGTDYFHDVVRVRKHPGAPASLPLLSAREYIQHLRRFKAAPPGSNNREGAH